jgi:hypothetical protein
MKKTRKHKHAPTTHLYCGSTSPRLASTEPSTNPTTRSAASRATQPPAARFEAEEETRRECDEIGIEFEMG